MKGILLVLIKLCFLDALAHDVVNDGKGIAFGTVVLHFAHGEQVAGGLLVDNGRFHRHQIANPRLKVCFYICPHRLNEGEHAAGLV